MKRPAASFVLLAGLAAVPVRAQDVDFGVKAGVNLAELEGGGLIEEAVAALDRRTGLTGGVFLRLPLGSAVSLQPEALYSQKGAELDLPLGEAAIELDYLDVTLPLRVDLLPDASVRPYLLGGPYAGIKLRARAVVRLVAEVDEDLDALVKDTDFGVLAGGGVRFAAGGVNLDVEARYGWGLTDVDEASLEGEEVRHRVFSLLAGVSF